MRAARTVRRGEEGWPERVDLLRDAAAFTAMTGNFLFGLLLALPTALLFALTLAMMVTSAVWFYGQDMEKGRRERAELYAGMVASGQNYRGSLDHDRDAAARHAAAVADAAPVHAISAVSATVQASG